MEGVLSWLNQPLVLNAVVQVWMVAAAGAVLLLLVLLLVVIRIRRKKKQAVAAVVMEEPTTERPAPLPELELANLQGVGDREEQQDAFGISRMDRCEEDGLLAVLCDGMGGMAEGARIASEAVSKLVGLFPWPDDSEVPGWIQQHSAGVYRQFRGHGGATLVAALIQGAKLSFWCVGDSDLFLLREGRLYAMNVRQEFRNQLILQALDGAFPVEEAFHDPQAGALSEYIGKETVRCDYTRLPFPLQPEDALLLCSDGVSDTLTLKQIREAMELPAQACCDQLEAGILAANKPGQDNYTAIVLKYHGKPKEVLS